MVRGLLQDRKVPGTSAGTSARGDCCRTLGESQVNGSLPCQTRLEQHEERPGCLKSQGGKEGLSGKHRENVGMGWGELRVGLCGALTRTAPGLAGEVGCVRAQALPCTEQKDFLKKKETVGGSLGNSAAAAPVSSPPGCPPSPPRGLCGASSPNPKHRAGGSAHLGEPEITGTYQGVYTPWADPRPQAPTGESATCRDLRPQTQETV